MHMSLHTNDGIYSLIWLSADYWNTVEAASTPVHLFARYCSIPIYRNCQRVRICVGESTACLETRPLLRTKVAAHGKWDRR